MLYLLILSSMVVKCFVFVNICTTYKYSNYAAAPYQHFIRYKSRIQILFKGSILYLYMIAAYSQILDITQFSKIYSNIYIYLTKRLRYNHFSIRGKYYLADLISIHPIAGIYIYCHIVHS